MKRTLIQQYATGIVKGLMEQVNSIVDLEHGPTKGHLRELFVANILNKFLTRQFGVGRGIVVNQKGDQSRETDIIIYDNRILPPFIWEEPLGVFPIESVVATIEVKSRMTCDYLIEADRFANQLREEIASPSARFSQKQRLKPPGCSFVGFKDGGVRKLMDESTGRDWLRANITDLWLICLVGGFSWVKFSADMEWRLHKHNEFFEETKRYICVLLDNIRTQSERSYSTLSKTHHDWLGIYIRDNDEVKRTFDARNVGPENHPSHPSVH